MFTDIGSGPAKSLNHPGLVKGSGGRWRAKLTDAQRRSVRFDYPNLTNEEVGRKFGISKTYAHYLRRGERGHGRLPPALRFTVESVGRMAEMELATKFLARSVPLLRNTLAALLELQDKQKVETSLDEPVEERWHGKAEADARGRPWEDGRISRMGNSRDGAHVGRELDGASRGRQQARHDPQTPALLEDRTALQRRARPEEAGDLLFDTLREGG